MIRALLAKTMSDAKLLFAAIATVMFVFPWLFVWASGMISIPAFSEFLTRLCRKSGSASGACRSARWPRRPVESRSSGFIPSSCLAHSCGRSPAVAIVSAAKSAAARWRCSSPNPSGESRFTPHTHSSRSWVARFSRSPSGAVPPSASRPHRSTNKCLPRFTFRQPSTCSVLWSVSAESRQWSQRAIANAGEPSASSARFTRLQQGLRSPPKSGLNCVGYDTFRS